MMKKMLCMALAGAMIIPVGALPARAQEIIQAELVDSFGKPTGFTTFRKTPKGVLVEIDASGLTGGWHGVHVHGTGDCSDHMDHFVKSSGHAMLGDQTHGYHGVKGPHSGDLPNIWAHNDGVAKAHFYSTDLVYDALVDDNGSAVMIHAGPDDYATQPAGDSGERIACGVIPKK